MTIATAEELAHRDARYAPSHQPDALERIARTMILDPRDYPFVRLSVVASAVLFPAAIALFVLRTFPWWLGALYLATVFAFFVDRFILMLHNTSHRQLFKKRYKILNQYIPWVLGPLLGETPEAYYVHHMGMHHPENNLPDDLSSTMPYQRDSFLHFLMYFGRFFFAGEVELSRYLLRKGRPRMFRRLLMGESAWLLAVILLWQRSWEATLVVLVIPMVAVRFLMMWGNWGQHAFVDAADPNNCWRNSVTCVDSDYNRRCFNDGYHIGHHLKASMHWTELPEEFARNAERYAAERALVFKGIDFFIVSLLLFLKQHKALARRYVHLGEGPRPSDDEIVAVMRVRLAPIRGTAVTPAV